jgi:acetyl esterase/lipase
MRKHSKLGISVGQAICLPVAPCSPIDGKIGANNRKCLDAGSAFPAPILDALAAYLYLTETLRFEARNIIMLGESSSGQLCLALSIYLKQLDLPQPGFFSLVSALCDMTQSTTSRKINRRFDYLADHHNVKGFRSAMRLYKEEVWDDPVFSPMKAKPSFWTYLRDENVKVSCQG